MTPPLHKKRFLSLLFLLFINSSTSAITKDVKDDPSGSYFNNKIGSATPPSTLVPLYFSSSTSVTAKIAIGQNQMITLVVDTGFSSVILKRSSSLNFDDPSLTISTSLTAFEYVVSVGGISYSATPYVAPLSINGAIAPNCPISLVNNDVDLPYDGVLGLGFDSSFIGFLDELGYNGTSKYFGVFLASHTVSSVSSELTLGGFNAKRFTGPLYWYSVPLNTPNWSFSIIDMSMYTPRGTSTTPLATNGIKFGKIDTASVYIVLDSNHAALINQQIGARFNNSVYVIPCSLKSLGPNVIFLLSKGSIPIHVLSANYVVEVEKNVCISAFKGGAENSQMVSFGIPFLQAVYTVYDYSESPHRIAFAQAVINSAVSSQLSSRSLILIILCLLQVF